MISQENQIDFTHKYKSVATRVKRQTIIKPRGPRQIKRVSLYSFERMTKLKVKSLKWM